MTELGALYIPINSQPSIPCCPTSSRSVVHQPRPLRSSSHRPHGDSGPLGVTDMTNSCTMHELRQDHEIRFRAETARMERRSDDFDLFLLFICCGHLSDIYLLVLASCLSIEDSSLSLDPDFASSPQAPHAAPHARNAPMAWI